MKVFVCFVEIHPLGQNLEEHKWMFACSWDCCARWFTMQACIMNCEVWKKNSRDWNGKNLGTYTAERCPHFLAAQLPCAFLPFEQRDNAIRVEELREIDATTLCRFLTFAILRYKHYIPGFIPPYSQHSFWRMRKYIKIKIGVFYMALGNCIHMFRPNFGPHQYSVNQLWLYDVFTAKTTV